MILFRDPAVELVTKNEASMCQLADRGSLTVGHRGELIHMEPGPQPRLIATIAHGQRGYFAFSAVSRLDFSLVKEKIFKN